jgi:glycosyltransferase involved in cell wall biosynthesis
VSEVRPRVSVLIPVFNAENYLEAALESVLDQTLQDLELIAIDDGSRDASRRILDKYAARDERVHVVGNGSNLGISATLNRGWKLARAPFVARMDADDISLPDRLQRQVAYLEEHGSVAAVGGAVVIIDAAGIRHTVVRYPTSPAEIRAKLQWYNCFAHPAVTIRRSALDSIGGYRYDHVEDYDLWLRLVERHELANLDTVVLLYRHHARQISLREIEEQARRTLAVRAAARIRSRSRVDPLAGIHTLSPDVLNRLGVTEPDVQKAVGHERLSWAMIMATLGRHAEAEALLDCAARQGTKNVGSAFSAGMQFAAAKSSLRSRRPVAAMVHGLRAVAINPRFALRKISEHAAIWARWRIGVR